MASIMKVACVVVMCMAVMGAPIALAITCGQVTGAMAPCITYLTKGGSVTERCCNGVKGLLAAAQTTADKQAACNCLKSAAASLKVNDAFAQALPGKCGVSSLPYKISTSTNCATIKF